METVIKDIKVHWENTVGNKIRIPLDDILSEGMAHNSNEKEIPPEYDEKSDDLSNCMLVENPDDFIDFINDIVSDNSTLDNHISMSSNIDDQQPGPCTSSFNTDIEQPGSSSSPLTEFKTKEAHAIYQVLNASSSLLERYECTKIIAKKVIKNVKQPYLERSSRYAIRVTSIDIKQTFSFTKGF